MDQKFSPAKVITALLLGYSCATAWVIYADVVYDNKVPIEAFEFHGLYPLSLGLSAVVTAFLFDRNLKSLGFSRFRFKYLLASILIPAVLLLVPFGINILTGMSAISASPAFDTQLVAIGIPVLIILAMGEELMWRGILFSELSKKYRFTSTSLIIGMLWVIWHYPVMIHTKFIYADRPLAFALAAFTVSVIASSFIYSYLRVVSKSIWPCILLHAFTNYIGFVFIEPIETTNSSTSVYFISDIGIFFALANIAGAAWVLKAMKKKRLLTEALPQPSSHLNGTG